MSRKLDETRSFLDLYFHICGESEVPHSYNLWAGISLIAGAVADRVWFTKFHGKKLAPNLYVALIGPSANGKGEAIDTAVRLTLDHPKIALYNGKASPQYLMSWMTRKRTLEDGTQVDCSKVYFVTPELSMALGKGDSADAIIKHMTELYTGRAIPILDGTVTRGLQRLTDYCVNWLIGTTLEWLLETVPASSISGGFFGRIIGVYEGYVRDRRVPVPKAPHDYDEVVAHLHARLTELVEIDGEFEMTPKARMTMNEWYTSRDWPSDESLVPAFKRQDDLVLKLAMILSLADDLGLVITAKHVLRAQTLSDSVLRKLGDIQAAAATTPATRGIAFVQQYLKGMRRPIMRSEILRRFVAKGLGDRDTLDIALRTLEDSNTVVHRPTGRGTSYQWLGKRRLPKDEISNNGGPPERD